MKPVFRRPSSIIKQFSGLTVNQDKATKPARFMQQHNAAQVSNQPTQSKKHETHPPHPHPRHTHRLCLQPYRRLRLCRQQRRFRRRDPNIPLVRPSEKTTQFSTIENKQIPNVKASFTLAFLTLSIGVIVHKFVSFVHYLYVRKRKRPSENRPYKPITRFKPIFNTNFINSLNKSPHLNLSLKKLFKSYIIY